MRICQARKIIRKEEYDGRPSYHTYKTFERWDFSQHRNQRALYWTSHLNTTWGEGIFTQHLCLQSRSLITAMHWVWPEFILVQKTTGQFYRKTNPMSCDVSTGPSTKRKTPLCICSMQLPSYYHWTPMKKDDAQTVDFCLKNKVTLRHIRRLRGVWEFALLDSDQHSIFICPKNSVLWSKVAQILEMSFSNVTPMQMQIFHYKDSK